MPANTGFPAPGCTSRRSVPDTAPGMSSLMSRFSVASAWVEVEKRSLSVM